jgi:hypothetical protein
MRRAVAFVVSFVLVAPVLVHAESLGEVAARERKKKEGKPAGKVITEADLGKHGRGTYNNPDDPSSNPPPDAPAPAGSSGGGASASGEKPKTDDEIRADNEKSWRDKLAQKNKEIANIRTRITQLENSNAFANPSTAQEIESLKGQLKTAETELQTLETERQRQGYKR